MAVPDYRNQIATQVANSAVNQLINELAARCEQVDDLNKKLADLEAKLQAKEALPTP